VTLRQLNKEDVIEGIIFVVGCLLSWIIAHFCCRRSSTETLSWVRELVDDLPDQQPKPSEFLRPYEEHLDSGEVEVNYPLGRVACATCGESAKNLEEKVFGEDVHATV